jgi:hypothetical protein
LLDFLQPVEKLVVRGSELVFDVTVVRVFSSVDTVAVLEIGVVLLVVLFRFVVAPEPHARRPYTFIRKKDSLLSGLSDIFCSFVH